MSSFDFLEIFAETSEFFLSIIAFLAQMGIPLGTIFFMMFAGSISNSYSEVFFLSSIVLLSTSCGDFLSFKIGNKYGTKLYEKFKHKNFIKVSFNNSSIFFKKYGNSSIFLSRFLFTGFGPFINYIAGIEKYNFKKFIIYVILGEIIYSFLFVILGFVFKETWQDLLGLISDFSTLILISIILILLLKKAISILKEK